MRYIAHRGNYAGANPSDENRPDYVRAAIFNGYEVEIDIWSINKKFYFGHNEPRYLLPENYNFLLGECWYHCKNLEALQRLRYISYAIRHFWHQDDDYTLVSDGHIWTARREINSPSAIIMIVDPTNLQEVLTRTPTIAGICCDILPTL